MKKKCGRCNRDFISRLDNNFCDSCQDDINEEVENEEPDYWSCGCGKVVYSKPDGFGCPMCGAIMEEQYF